MSMPSSTDARQQLVNSFRACWFALSWLLGKPWMLALLAVGALANLPQRLISTVLLHGDAAALLIPSARDSLSAIQTHFSDWTNYAYDPIATVGYPPVPFALEGDVLDLSALFAFAGLCVFRIRHGGRNQTCARVFNAAFAATGAFLLLLIAGARYITMASHVPQWLREMDWLSWEGSIVLLPFQVAVSSTTAALFAGAILGRLYAAGSAPQEGYTLRDSAPLLTFYAILITTLRLLALAPYMLLHFFPSLADSAETVYEACALLCALLPASLLFVPVFIARERTGLLAAVSRNLALLGRKPIGVLLTLAIFAMLAFSVQSGLALVLSPVSRSWLAGAAVSQWIELVLYAVYLIAATRLPTESVASTGDVEGR